MKHLHSRDLLALAAAKGDMDEKTSRKYRRAGRLPSQAKPKIAHRRRMRVDPFEPVWPGVSEPSSATRGCGQRPWSPGYINSLEMDIENFCGKLEMRPSTETSSVLNSVD